MSTHSCHSDAKCGERRGEGRERGRGRGGKGNKGRGGRVREGEREMGGEEGVKELDDVIRTVPVTRCRHTYIP